MAKVKIARSLLAGVERTGLGEKGRLIHDRVPGVSPPLRSAGTRTFCSTALGEAQCPWFAVCTGAAEELAPEQSWTVTVPGSSLGAVTSVTSGQRSAGVNGSLTTEWRINVQNCSVTEQLEQIFFVLKLDNLGRRRSRAVCLSQGACYSRFF